MRSEALALPQPPEDGRAAPPPEDPPVQTLADARLLGLLLTRGRLDERSLALARHLLAQVGGLAALGNASPALLRHYGLRDGQVSALLAAYELACRFAHRSVPERQPLERPALVARYLTLRYQQRDQEVMGALFLDVRHRLIGDQETYRGTLHRAAVEPREILKQCLLRGAARVVIFHTHPSGDPTPSSEDVLFTRRMAEACELVGVDLADHLVLGSIGRWVSLKERGAWVTLGATAAAGLGA
jgi:DNA repair protein RadC